MIVSGGQQLGKTEEMERRLMELARTVPRFTIYRMVAGREVVEKYINGELISREDVPDAR